MPETNPNAGNLPTELGFKDLVAKANSGDQLALAQLRKILDENPQVWTTVGNLAMHARLVLARALAGGDQLALESILRHAHEMETDLLGPNPTQLERLCAQRIVACWLETQFAAIKGPEPTGETLKHARFALQVRESAEKRFHAAIKSYSLVRQLLVDGGKAADRRQPNTPAAPDAAANGNGHVHEETSNTTAPATGDGHASHVPANRIGQLIQASPPKVNGHTNRLSVFEPSSHAVKPQPEPEGAVN